MIIHSKFQDYYDIALSHGVDNSIHWTRSEKKINIGHAPRQYGLSRNHHKFFSTEVWKQASKLYDIILPTSPAVYWDFYGVCGKIHPCLRVKIGYEEYFNLFRIDDFQKLIDILTFQSKSKIKEKSIKNIQNTEKLLKTYYFIYNNSRFLDLFIELNAPIFKIGQYEFCSSEYQIITDFKLKNSGIESIYHPYQMYQNIEQFLTGVLRINEPETIEVQDKYKILGHGFDECSFRKKPSKRKTKCCY